MSPPDPRRALVARVTGAIRSPAWLVLSGHALLQGALFKSDGHMDTIALWLAVAAVATWGLAVHASVARAPANLRDVQKGAWALVLWCALEAFNVPPGINVEGSLAPFHALSAVVTALVATYALDVFGLVRVPPLLAGARRALLFALALLIGAWLLRASPSPKIDLFPVQQQAAQTMLSGRSIYAPGALDTVETYLQSYRIDAYMYYPLGACCTTLAYALTHDVRWADLVAQLVGGALVWLAARSASSPEKPGGAGAWPDLLAAAFLFHPRGLFVLEQAWLEPLALPFLGGFVYFATRGRFRAASVSLGLLCGVKQHLVLYVPFFAFVPGIGFSGVVLAGVVSLATILPFALPQARGFYRSVIYGNVHGWFRPDALSIPAAVSRYGYVIPSWVGFLAALAPFAWLRRVPRELTPLLVLSCITFGLFYLFGRQAFCNYYYLLDATAIFAAAAVTGERERDLT